jgi:hypothetical protein
VVGGYTGERVIENSSQCRNITVSWQHKSARFKYRSADFYFKDHGESLDVTLRSHDALDNKLHKPTLRMKDCAPAAPPDKHNARINGLADDERGTIGTRRTPSVRG